MAKRYEAAIAQADFAPIRKLLRMGMPATYIEYEVEAARRAQSWVGENHTTETVKVTPEDVARYLKGGGAADSLALGRIAEMKAHEKRR